MYEREESWGEVGHYFERIVRRPVPDREPKELAPYQLNLSVEQYRCLYLADHERMHVHDSASIR